MQTHNGPNLQTRTFGIATRSFNEAARTCDFIASTNALDSYDEVVEQDWDLSRYRANPVVLWAHNSRELPIGQCTRCEVVAGKLECTLRFERHEKAETIFQMVKSGTLRAVSVGFIPGEHKMDKRGGKDVVVLRNNKLHEISVVSIPANPEALAKALGGRGAPRPEVTLSLGDLVEEPSLERGLRMREDDATSLGDLLDDDLFPRETTEGDLGDLLEEGVE